MFDQLARVFIESFARDTDEPLGLVIENDPPVEVRAAHNKTSSIRVSRFVATLLTAIQGRCSLEQFGYIQSLVKLGYLVLSELLVLLFTDLQEDEELQIML